jgi:CheY-like chemotaxis protein
VHRGDVDSTPRTGGCAVDDVLAQSHYDVWRPCCTRSETDAPMMGTLSRARSPMSDRIRVVVADDDDSVRAALVDTLRADPRFEVLAAVATGSELVDACSSLRPDVALVDVQMPGGGEEAVRAVMEQSICHVVIAISASVAMGTILPILRAGATGYLAKGNLGRSLPDLVARCAKGQALLAVPGGGAILRALVASAPR